MHELAADSSKETPLITEARKSLPLERLFSSFVLDAREQLRQQTDARLYDLLTVKAHESWEAYLLRRLNSAGKKVVDQQFQIFRSFRSAFSGATGNQRSEESSAYHKFTGDNPTERLGKILDEFPELARVCKTLVANWISTVRDFLERLDRDLPKFPHHFKGRSYAHPVDELHVGLSDPHRGGRCVVRIVFPGSESLIYKPRSLASEALFTVLLEQLNGKGPPYNFRGARCWDREDYGWMEDVVTRPCSESVDLHAFYWRAGVLLALVYLSRGVDMHKGNLIADGAYPVLIDLETLWHPQEHIGAGDDPIANTVLRTGFLPQSNIHSGATYELNALGHRSISGLQEARHLPVFAGTEYLAPDFLPDILAGFRWFGEQVFKEHRFGGEFQLWVQALARCRRRRILRSTSWYGSVIERMIAPSSLRTAAECPGVGRNDPPLTEDEKLSLLQIDVPYIEQTVEHEQEQKVTLPVQSIEAFLKQEAVIIDAFAPAAAGTVCSKPLAGSDHHSGSSVQSIW